jgi:hypothetical protein
MRSEKFDDDDDDNNNNNTYWSGVFYMCPVCCHHSGSVKHKDYKQGSACLQFAGQSKI